MASLNTYTGVLGHRLAAHLLRRATFNITKERIALFAGYTPTQAVAALMNVPAKQITEPRDPDNNAPWISDINAITGASSFNLYNTVKDWWLNEARIDTSAAHKAQFFLFTNFVCVYSGYAGRHLYDYLSILDQYKLGNFEELAFKISTANSMLYYLDNNTNDKDSPNENYARELLELFTIGKGPQIGPGDYTNYQEHDVQMAAKVLTGFKAKYNRTNIDPDLNIPMGYAKFNKHDTTDKTFSSAFGNHTITGAVDANDMYRELQDMITMIFDQDETARFICRKIYRYYVSRNITPEIETDIINPLATTFRDNNYNLQMVLEQLFKSEHFYDKDDSDNNDEIIGALIKSPMEMLLQTLTYLKMPVPDPFTQPWDHYHNFYHKWADDIFLALAGQKLLEPQVVAGYPAHYQGPTYDRNWFSSSTIIVRYKLYEMLKLGKKVLTGGNIGGVKFDVAPFISTHISTPNDATILINELVADLFPEPISTARFDYLKDDILLDGLSDLAWHFTWLDYASGATDDADVKVALDTLFTTIFYSQEYQCN